MIYRSVGDSKDKVCFLNCLSTKWVITEGMKWTSELDHLKETFMVRRAEYMMEIHKSKNPNRKSMSNMVFMMMKTNLA